MTLIADWIQLNLATKGLPDVKFQRFQTTELNSETGGTTSALLCP